MNKNDILVQVRELLVKIFDKLKEMLEEYLNK